MNRYYKSLHEIEPSAMQQADPLPDEGNPQSMFEILADKDNHTASSRRDFLKWCGISFVSATVLSACENPVKKAIPYLNQPETLIPGKASWYASTWMHGNEYCPVLVKSRDGRPIKIEGNDLSSITGGGTSARVQASVLSLYDNGARYHQPLLNKKPVSWDEVDGTIRETMDVLRAEGRRMALVVPSLISPSTRALVGEFATAYPNLEVVTWDAVSYSAIRKAHERCFNRAIIPGYRFDKASLIVSFSADFLGTWLSPVEFAHGYAKKRRVTQENPDMSKHIQFEATLSLTGANADERVPLKPSEERKVLKALHNSLVAASGLTTMESIQTGYDVQALAAEMMRNPGQSLVVSGHNDQETQILVAMINHLTGAYGNTIDIGNPLNIGQDDPLRFEELVNEMNNGLIEAALFYQTNPAYHYHDPARFLEGLSKVPLSVSFATTKDETAEACSVVLPDNHYLESWNDAAFKAGRYSLAQPLIRPLFKTRQFQDTLLTWLGKDKDFHTYIKDHWERELFPGQSVHASFNSFWVEALQKGVYESKDTDAVGALMSAAGIYTVSVNIPPGELEFCLHPHLAIYDGHDANNPWLQELPEPISSVTWDNFAAIAPATAAQLGLTEGDIIRINDKVEVPLLIQPGQAPGTISIALGYGRTHAGVSADQRGGNAFLLTHLLSGNRMFTGPVEHWQKTGSKHVFARTQTHFSMEGRPIVRESNLAAYRDNPSAGNELRAYHLKYASSLYPETTFEGHHWALMVDLNACTGCSACVIGCQVENNIPVIGKDQVRRRRIMHWMRIDRYYNGDPANPGVVFQPLMCQHCDHAPCENVCPVAATTHSHEGINQVTYNRCVGTKYCINNCPYKVRRFNWYEYATKEQFNTHTTTELGRMVLNPDVTVRERGVVEKCSFCVQRIQEAKLTAKNERRKLADGEIIPACAQACPSNALVFGDLNDPGSRVSQLIKDPRNYHLLEELHTLPSVGYLTKIRNNKA